MSIEIALRETAAHLRSNIVFQATPEIDQCTVTPGAAVPTGFTGAYFYAVYDDGAQNDSIEHHGDERYSVAVSIFMRASTIPTDRKGTRMVNLATTGLQARARVVINHVAGQGTTGRYTLMDACNTAAGDDGFCEPFRYKGTQIIDGDPDWLECRVRFAEMRRVQDGTFTT